MEMNDFNNNNELAKPMSQNNYNIYAKPQPQVQPQFNTKTYQPYQIDQPPAQQIIIVQSTENERPINFLCFGEQSLENRARMNFVRKVYMLLAFQLLITIGFCCLSYFCVPFFEFQINFWWVTLIVIALMYVGFAFLICGDTFRQYPYNLGFLTLFTLCFSYIISQVTSAYAYAYGGPLVLLAAGLTLFMVVGLTLFALFSRNNFNGLFAGLFVVGFTFLGFGLLCIVTLQPVLYQLYCALVVSFLGILLVIDTKLIMGGGRSISVSMDDSVMGALMLYIDIMRIFIWILRLLALFKK